MVVGTLFSFWDAIFSGNSKNIIKPCPVDLSPNPCLQDLEIWIQAIDEKRRWKTFLSSFNTREISKRRCRRQGEHERFEQQQRWRRWPLTWLLALYWLLHDGIHIMAYWNSHISNKQPRIFVHCSSRKKWCWHLGHLFLGIFLMVSSVFWTRNKSSKKMYLRLLH